MTTATFTGELFGIEYHFTGEFEIDNNDDVQLVCLTKFRTYLGEWGLDIFDPDRMTQRDIREHAEIVESMRKYATKYINARVIEFVRDNEPKRLKQSA